MKSACLSLFILVAAIAAAQPAAQRPLFIEAAAQTGLVFRHVTGATGDWFMPEIMGAGAALLDYDNDGDLDVYLIQGRVLNEKKGLRDARFPAAKGWRPGNRLFRNEQVPSGALKFTDVTEASGAGVDGYGMGAATGDYDNDGDVDLYVTNFGANTLLRNNGNGTFTDVTRESGADDPRWSTSAAFLDYDRDGDLDLFVCNYLDFTVAGNKRCLAPTGESDYCAPNVYRAQPSRLLRNEGGGRFADATQRAGIGAAFGPALGVACADFNGDGRTDIYVANDGAANLLWINRGDGTFEEQGLMAGAAYSADGAARAGMGLAVDDFDNDGDEDILVTNLTRQGSTLYRNNGQGLFDDATIDARLAQPSLLSTGFGVAWFDYDHDGRRDLFAANGAVTLLPALRGQAYPYHQANQLFHNEDGRAFRETTTAAGPAFRLSEVSRGAATGDIDNDGDVDLLVTNNNGPARLLLNQAPPVGSHRLQARAIDAANRDAIGARVALLRPNAPALWNRVRTDGSYLSAGDPRVHFGLGALAGPVTIGVIWPDGSREMWENLQPDKLHTLRQKTGKIWLAPVR
ncbi:MAG: CRTAC1 family protein [Blastocatellia bacterium]|nr:CRTAC1 family protein [Blastocatellia bacterium]